MTLYCNNCGKESKGGILWKSGAYMVCNECKTKEEICETLEDKNKNMWDCKMGETINHNLLNDVMKAPNKLVKKSYTFQDKNGMQMVIDSIHNDYERDENEEADLN